MKQLFIIWTAVLISTLAHGQLPDPHDQTKLIVKHKVKSVKTYSCDSTAKEYYCAQYVYDRKGNQVQEIYCRPGRVDTFFYKYDSLNHKTLCTRSKGQIAEKYFNTYNKIGELTKTVWKPIGEPREYDRIETKYYYDDKGRVIKTHGKSYSKEKKLIFEDIITYYYNESNQLRLAVFGTDSLKNSTEYFFYDDNGLLVREVTNGTHFYNGSNPRDRILIFHYDNNGFLISRETNETNGNTKTIVTQTVDQNGLIQNIGGQTCYEYEYFQTGK